MSRVENRDVSDVLAMIGISQQEAADYLKARGIKASFGAVKAWCRGNYSTPNDAYTALWSLFRDVINNDPEHRLPVEAPEAAVVRREMYVRAEAWRRFQAESVERNRNFEDPD